MPPRFGKTTTSSGLTIYPGSAFGVFAFGKRSYVLQYRSAVRSRRYTIGLHGVLTPERARQEAKVQLGRVAKGDNPADERQLDHNAIMVKELCGLYLTDLKAGLILRKGGRPKKATTIGTDTGRIDRHIIPLTGTRRVRDLTKADINKVLKDIMAGKARVSVKTKKLRGRSIVSGSAGTVTRTVGLLGGILTFAVEAGIDPSPGFPSGLGRVLGLISGPRRPAFLVSFSWHIRPVGCFQGRDGVCGGCNPPSMWRSGRVRRSASRTAPRSGTRRETAR